MSTVNVIQQRLMALCGRIVLPGGLGMGLAYEDEEECAFEMLPAYVVTDQPDELYGRLDESLYQAQQDFFITVYLSRVCDESYRANVPAWTLVKDCREAIADFFTARPTLALNDAGVCDHAQPLRARRMTLQSKDGAKFHGLVLRMATTFTRSLAQYDTFEDFS